VRPDVIVTDISMPEQGGLTAVRTILAQRPDVAVVFATIHDAALVIQSAVATGALGYVVKTDCADELEAAVWAAVAGHEYLSTSARAALAAQREPE
jgi:two-component system NarL family response regulator